MNAGEECQQMQEKSAGECRRRVPANAGEECQRMQENGAMPNVCTRCTRVTDRAANVAVEFTERCRKAASCGSWRPTRANSSAGEGGENAQV